MAYVRNPIGEFVESLRKELHPELPHLDAHVTLLPPRFLRSDDDRALHTHPWLANFSWLLRGGYREHSPEGFIYRSEGATKFRWGAAPQSFSH